PMGVRGTDSQALDQRANQTGDPRGDKNLPATRCLGATLLRDPGDRASSHRALATSGAPGTEPGQPDAGSPRTAESDVTRRDRPDCGDGQKPGVCRPLSSHHGSHAL